MNNFYITVENDDGTSENGDGGFLYNLPKPLDLKGKWQVAVSEVSFGLGFRTHDDYLHHRFDVYSDLDFLNSLFGTDEDIMEEWARRIHYTTGYNHYLILASEAIGRKVSFQFIHKFYFESTQDLADTINGKMQDICVDLNLPLKSIFLAFNYKEHAFYLVNPHKNVKIIFFPQLAKLLNFKMYRQGHAIFDQINFPFNLTHFQIHSNLIKPQIVGSGFQQLLRSVPCNRYEKSSSDQNVCFNNPHFFDISSNRISSIICYIKDHRNSPLHFFFGKIRITFEFKQKND